MFERVKKVITAEEVKKLLPVGEKIASVKADNDETLRNLVSGKDKRFLLVCGPCSADNEDAVAEYCVKLKALSDRYDDRLVIVPRVFTAKAQRCLGGTYEAISSGESSGILKSASTPRVIAVFSRLCLPSSFTSSKKKRRRFMRQPPPFIQEARTPSSR